MNRARVSDAERQMLDLLPGVRAGNEQICTAFAEAFGERLRKFFVYSGISVADAEDLAWETLTIVFRDLDRVHDRDARGVLNWTYGIARHKACDWYRRNKVRLLPLEAAVNLVGRVSTEPTPQEVALFSAVDRGLAQLSTRDREILILRSSDVGGTFGNVAEILGITKGAARVRYARARKRAQDVLEAFPEVRKRLAGK